ncbi:hypothetical protein VNO77_34458 [Canavalia gladiata]|uniref:Secreted protein n=1 Tax=Canavalia gladiata TaxID=3824 RepID=A0AAN9PYJ5_CANGL
MAALTLHAHVYHVIVISTLVAPFKAEATSCKVGWLTKLKNARFGLEINGRVGTKTRASRARKKSSLLATHSHYGNVVLFPCILFGMWSWGFEAGPPRSSCMGHTEIHSFS